MHILYGKKKFFLRITVFCFSYSAYSMDVQSLYTMENNNQTLNQKGIIDKTLAVIATSGVMHYYNQFFAKKILPQNIFVPKIALVLGKEAQTAIGISADRQVPIRYIPDLNASAIAETNTIIIGKEFTQNETAYGVKRCNMFHEAVHIKYHDNKFNGVLLSCSFLGIPLIAKMFIKLQGKLKLLYMFPFLAGYYIGRAIQGKFENYRERRADIEGHYATQCYKCVNEKIEDIRSAYEVANGIITRLNHNINLNEEQVSALKFAKDWIENKKRYLSIEENTIIVRELELTNKVCKFHEESK